MVSTRTLVRRYLAHRRSMGYLLCEGHLLLDFARFKDSAAPDRPLTTALALQWATSIPTNRRATHANRLSMVRSFARYCALLDPRTQVPEPYLLGRCFRRIRPHIFTPAQVALILRRTQSLSTHLSPLQPMTYATLIGLLACTGMRPGEALHLRLDDFQPQAGLLRIGRCKSSPERMIPLHATTVRALQDYCRARRSLFPSGESLFVGTTGQPVQPVTMDLIFRRLAAGIASNGERPSCRLMDFRHSYASQCIAQLSRQSKPVSHYLLRLARYLGHRDFSSTWWYVSTEPKSLRSAANSFGRFHEQNQPLP
jgi:integrase